MMTGFFIVGARNYSRKVDVFGSSTNEMRNVISLNVCC